MESYVYPFDEFLRDFDALVRPFNAATPTVFAEMDRVSTYARRTYPDPGDCTTRGLALFNAFHYISQHIADFDTGRIAVAGEDVSMVSNDLLRAIHILVCDRAMNATGEYAEATPAEVCALAEQFAEQNTSNEPSASPET